MLDAGTFAHIIKAAQGVLGAVPSSSRRAYAARSLPFPASGKGAGGTSSERRTGQDAKGRQYR